MSTIIGRRNEVEELEKLYHSERPEFVAIYGRRRVGKTFLIKQALKGRITFQHTGVSPVDQEGEKNRMKTQLDSFYYSLLSHGWKRSSNWNSLLLSLMMVPDKSFSSMSCRGWIHPVRVSFRLLKAFGTGGVADVTI